MRYAEFGKNCYCWLVTRIALRFFCLALASAAINACGVQTPVDTGEKVHAGDSDAEMRYLAFQMFTDGPGMGRDDGDCGLTGAPDRAQIERFADRLAERIGLTGHGDARLAVVIGPLAFDHGDEQIRQVISDGFDVARDRGVAIGFHIDDSKFWGCREELLADQANIERIGWDAPPSTGQYLNWGEPWRLPPQMCLTAPAIRSAARDRAGAVIANSISRELAQTEAKLFAGVMVGWETAIGIDFETRERTGYCALEGRGFGADTTRAMRDEALQDVVKGWIGLWAGELAAAGVPKNRIDSHIAFRPRQSHNDPDSYPQAVGYSTIATAFGDDWLPGFSTYPDPDLFQEIHQEMSLRTIQGWASAEGANIILDPTGPYEPDADMEAYLSTMFNHGATLTVLFGWGLGRAGEPFTSAAERDTALEAYRKFLRGEELTGSYRPGDFARAGSLPAKINRMHEQIRSFVNRGGDPSDIEPLVQEIDRLLRAGEMGKAEGLIDEVLALTA